MNKQLLQRLDRGQYERTESGIFFPHERILARGLYVHDVNGKDRQADPNIVTDEGLTYLLSAGLFNGTRYATFALTLYAANYTPTNTLTAASFPATASEITSTTEGFTNSTRPAWTAAAPSGDGIDNTGSLAAFNMITASALTVNGAALLSSNVRGDTTGVCVSATKFAATRTLYNGDVFNLSYRVQLASS